MAAQTPPKPSQPQQSVVTDLAARINQRRDSAKREAALAEIHQMLAAGEAARQIEALRALAAVDEVNFDHEQYALAVRRSIVGPDAGVRVAALQVLPKYGGTPDDLPTLIRLGDDPSPDVRATVGRTYVAINGRTADAAFDGLLLKLLADPESRVQRGALGAMAHSPVGDAVEARLIAMSMDDAVKKDRGLLRDVVHLGLTTRPTISVPVTRRLIDMLIDAPDEADFPARICWSFRNGTVDPSVQDEVVNAVVVVFNDTLNTGIRDNCIAALEKIKTDAALNALEAIASDPDVHDRFRQAAARAMATL